MTIKVTIVGGGYAGTMLARSLDSLAEVTLVEPRDKWVHNVAMIRALAQPGLLDQIIMPYDGLLKNGDIVRGRAATIEETTTVLEDGTRIEGEIVVVATGASYAAPFKMQGDDSEAFLKLAKRIIGQVDKAENISIVGAGAVGVELAGEIASARPEKSITLLSADLTLFPAYPPKLGRSMKRQLEELGVKVRLEERIAKLQKSDEPYKPATGKLPLSDGFPIPCDLVIPAIGSKPVTALMKSLEAVEFDTQGRVKVDDWLRPAGQQKMFVLGDIASAGDSMTIVGLTRQAGWMTKMIKAYIRGRAVEKFKAYKPWLKPLILLPLGTDKGASALPFGVVGPLLTSAIKGKKLFIPRYHREFDWTP